MLDEDKSGLLTRDELQIFAMATCGGLTDKRHGPLETQIENTLDQLDTGANGRYRKRSCMRASPSRLQDELFQSHSASS